MVDFAGWSMPVQYTSVISEHTATREAAGTFDISHMGRIRIEGTHAAKFLDRIVTRRVTDMRPGQIRYALVTNEQGGILDDVLVYHLETPSGRSQQVGEHQASQGAPGCQARQGPVEVLAGDHRRSPGGRW